MKKTMLAVLLLVTAVSSEAEPYFHTLLDLKSAQFEIGAGLDPKGVRDPKAVSVAAFAWHAPASPTLSDPAWSPLTLGGSGSTWDQFTFIVGPSVNLAPQAQALLYQALDFLAPDSFANIKDSLTPVEPPSQNDAGLCIAPLLEVTPSRHFHSRLLIFTGGWLKFGK